MERSRRIATTLKGVFPFVQADRLGAEAGTGLRILCGALLLLAVAAIIGVSAMGILSLRGSSRQIVQVTFHDVQGATVNQSAVVNQEEDLVTYHIMDRNHTAVVLFDSKNGLVCYQPGGSNVCLVRQMTAADLENIHTVITAQEQKEQEQQLALVQHHQTSETHTGASQGTEKFNQLLLLRNETRFSREYLGILSRNKVDPLTLGEHINSLCNHIPVYWLQKSDGPGRQRLIYFCIDICFPNNVCVSVCFYYLPD